MFSTLILQVFIMVVFFGIVIFVCLLVSYIKLVIDEKLKTESYTDGTAGLSTQVSTQQPNSVVQDIVPCGDISLSSPITKANESNPPINTIQFSSPLLVNNVIENIVNFNNDVRFDNNTLFDKNNNVSIDGSIYLNSESSIYFDYLNNRTNKLTREDVIPIKMAKAKSDFLINSTSDISQFVDGRRVSSYSSQTGGSSKCTSTIWDIITGMKPPGSELCRNCCKKSKGNGLMKVVIIHKNNRVTEIVLDMIQNPSFLHTFKVCESSVQNGTKILLFKTSEDISCRLVLLNEDLTGYDRQPINNRISDIKGSNTRNTYYEIKSSDQEWGQFNSNVVSETEHIVNTNSSFQYAYLESLK